MRFRPGERYTPSQLRRLMSQADADELKMKGYVLQFDVVSQTYGVVHWTQAASGADPGTFRPDTRGGTGLFEPLPSIQKRTPNERVDSLMMKMIDDCKKSGTVPGLSDERINTILGASKGTKRDGITAEEVRRVAAHFLQDAEDKHELKLSKQITRHED